MDPDCDAIEGESNRHFAGSFGLLGLDGLDQEPQALSRAAAHESEVGLQTQDTAGYPRNRNGLLQAYGKIRKHSAFGSNRMTSSAPGGTSAAQDAGNSGDGGVGTAPAAARKTIGSVASDAIREGLTNEQALERVLAEFPYARTTKHTIGKYRRMLRNGGEPVPTAAQARAEAAHGQPSTSPSRPRGASSDRRRSAPPSERETVGSVALNAIRDGKTNRQVVEIVKAHFPEARISGSSVNSYRSRLRRRGEAVLTAREATDAYSAGSGLLVADLEAARAARDEMATKADLSALEARLVRRLAGLVVAAGIAVVAAVTLLS